MNVERILSNLQRHEWTMGNGQCRECCGVPPKWYGYSCYMEKERIGHSLNCSVGFNIRELGGITWFKGEFKPTKEQQAFRDAEKQELDRFYAPIVKKIVEKLNP